MSAYLSRGVVHQGSPVDLLAHMSEAEKDAIAELVLAVAREAVGRQRRTEAFGLDRNVRPEPPEASLGFMPRSAA